MTFTLLIVGVAAITFMYVTTVRAGSPALASEQTAVGLGDPASDTLAYGNQPHADPRTEWRMTTVNDLTDAEDLLDYLENQGIEDRELVVLGNSCFAVRWR
jgi:hypothetical protein